MQVIGRRRPRICRFGRCMLMEASPLLLIRVCGWAAAELNRNALKLMKQRQNAKVPVLFSDLDAVVEGRAHDDLTHEVGSAHIAERDGSSAADFFPGCCQLEPFLNAARRAPGVALQRPGSAPCGG